MKRASSVDNSASVSLFPFLAVLLCTMGALIVLLVVIASQSRLQAVQREAAKASQGPKENEESIHWASQVANLETARAARTGTLQRNRLVLSHLEARIRQLIDQIHRLQQAAADLMRAGSSGTEQLRRDQAEVVRLKELIAEAQRQLDEVRREAEQLNRSYAVVPYEGLNRTGRRPIFVECLADEVILQPEGVVLTSQDFEEPLGPGNPLSAALRAARQYLLDRQASATGHTAVGGAKDPYPLLLVRPQGISAYYRVRRAIASWDSDYGYELIDDQWPLDFPTADPQLAQIEQRAVEEARLRRARLMLAAPSQFIRSDRGTFQGTPTGEGFDRFLTRGHAERESTGDRVRHGSFARRRARQNGQQTRQQRMNPKREMTPKQAMTSKQETTDKQGHPPPERPGPTGIGTPGVGGVSSIPNLVQRRGRNWALPETDREAVPISRPVHVVLREDQIAILPEADTRVPSKQSGTVIPFEGRPEDVIDEFVPALWDHMHGWGIAGNGMYWKPVLELHVGPGGERRAAQVKKLLHGSGIGFVDESRAAHEGRRIKGNE